MMTFEELKNDHVEFLRGKGLEVNALDTTGKFVRCKLIGQSQGRGEYTYKVSVNQMQGEKVGMVTWVRAPDGEDTHKSYGRKEGCQPKEAWKPSDSDPAKKVHDFFFKFCNTEGSSDYLQKKGVKAYGTIRFRPKSDKYGSVAIVPAYDVSGELRTFQYLNSGGTKLFYKGIPTPGLFYPLQSLDGTKLIGIAESYVTASTIKEVCGLAMVSAFSSDNLKNVALSIGKKYKCTIIIFADNDRHLTENKGMMKAEEACNACIEEGIAAGYVLPNFGDILADRDTTDFNDLRRERGNDEVMRQILSLKAG